MANIVYVPGILGSLLGYRTRVFGLATTRLVWLDPTILATGELATLQLDGDGVSPGPLAGGRQVVALNQWVWSYEPLAAWLERQGHRVLRVAYDWRRDVFSSGGDVLRMLDSAYPQQPFVLLGHSMGGLVGRAVWDLMTRRGDDARMVRLITLGTPQWGSWQAVQMFFRLGLAYRGLYAADMVRTHIRYGVGVSPLDAIVATWPAVYGLLPWRDYGPLHDTDPALAAAMYETPFWGGGNAQISAARLLSAASTQTLLHRRWPAGRVVTIIGVAQQTPYQWVRARSLTGDDAYLTSDDGDGVVLRPYATLPGEQAYTVPSTHYNLPMAPGVWTLLPALLA